MTAKATRILMTSAAAVALGIGSMGAVHAQTVEGAAPPGEAAAGADAPVTPLEVATRTNVSEEPDEIVVTAMRREQRLQDVPISIEVLSGETLADFNATDVRSVMNYTPNVFVQTTAGNHVIYIRGFGSPPSNFSFDQSVSLYVDGIYAGRNRQVQAPFFDIARVEVLRGPQGALFGKNTPAGAVSIVSKSPGNDFEGEITAGYNFDFDGYDLTGAVSVPISDSFAIRLAGRLLDQDGYIRNLATDHDDPETEMQLARLTAQWEPTATFDFTAKVEYGHQDVIGGISVSSPLTTAQDPQLTRFLEDSDLGQEGTTNESLMVSGTGNLDIGEHTLTSITGYSWFNSNIINGFDQSIPGGGVTGNSVYNSYPERFDQFSQEVRLLSPTGGTLEYVVGVYYDTSSYALTQLGGFNIPALNYFGLLQTNFDQTASSKSIFGQATYRVTDALRLVGSLRYTHTDKEGFFDGELVYGPFALRPVNTVAEGEISEGNVDPSLTLQYDIDRNVMVYATYGRGSKSGGFVSNTYGTTDDTFIFRPEKSRNYEVGIKSTLFDGRLVLNAAAYDTQFKNLQVSIYNPTLQIYQTGNAAQATARGVEGSIIWNPVPDFDLSASGAYNDQKYDDYPGAACLALQPVSECNPADPASIAANNLAGYRPVNSSRFSGSIQAHMRVPLQGGLQLDTTAIVAGRSRYYNADNQHPVFGYQKGYAKLDMRVQLGPDDRSWHVAVIGKNLTNELTTGSSFNLPAPITAAPRAILYLEPPRNIAVEAGIRF